MVGGCGGPSEPGGSMWDEGGEGQRDGRQVVGGGAAGRVCVGRRVSVCLCTSLALDPSKGEWGWACFPFPVGAGPPAQRGGPALGS